MFAIGKSGELESLHNRKAVVNISAERQNRVDQLNRSEARKEAACQYQGDPKL